MALGFTHQFYFGWHQNLNLGTFGWILEHISHYDVIVSYDDINDKNRLYNASSTIFRIAESYILFYLPLKFFGRLYYSIFFPLFCASSKFQKALKYRTIPRTTLLLPPMIKAQPIEESYLLPDDLFCQPISYATVSLTLLLFFPLSDRAHQYTYAWLLCYSVSLI